MNSAISNQRLLVLMFTDLVGSSALKTKLGDVDYANKVVRPHNAIFARFSHRFPAQRKTTIPEMVSWPPSRVSATP